MKNNWTSFRPRPRAGYTALIAAVVTALAVFCRRVNGDDGIALALGLSAILIGTVAYIMLRVEMRRSQRDLLLGSPRHERLSNRGRRVAWIGAATVLGSFMWLGAMIVFFGASPKHMLFFRVWLVIFSIGFVLLWFPIIRKLMIMLGLNSPDDS